MKMTLDQAAMYMTMFYYQNLDQTWGSIFPDIDKGFHGTRIGDYKRTSSGDYKTMMNYQCSKCKLVTKA